MLAMQHTPPSSIPPFLPLCDISGFCNRYGLDDEVKAGLTKLGFQAGDDLSAVTEKQYLDAGLKPLSWAHVLKANDQYKVDTQHGP